MNAPINRGRESVQNTWLGDRGVPGSASHGGVGNKRVEVCTDHHSPENWATADLKIVGGPSQRQARWHEFFSQLELHVVYTPGPLNPVDDFLSRWAYPASPALGDVSIHGTAQGDGDVRNLMTS